MKSPRHSLRVLVAVTASLGVHFAAAMASNPAPPPVEIEGGATAEIAALGSSFENLLQGSQAAQPAEVTPAKSVEAATEPASSPQNVKSAPAEPTQTAATALSETAQPTKPVQVARNLQPPVTPLHPIRTASRSAQITQTAPAAIAPAKTATESATAAATAFVATARPTRARYTGSVPAPPETAQQARPAETAATAHASAQPTESASQARPVAPPTAVRTETTSAASAIKTAALTPAHATETIEAGPGARPIPIPIARPPQPQDRKNLARAAETQRKKAEKPKTTVRKQKVASVPRGNADRNARAGSASGQEKSQAKSGGGKRGGKAPKAGNAKASNYPGKVYAKIRRTRQKRAGGRGVVRIRFSISSSGGLASVRVASSSGSSAIDRVALDHIRRSAPFPAPPAGAQRQFVIPVEVRR